MYNNDREVRRFFFGGGGGVEMTFLSTVWDNKFCCVLISVKDI